MANAFEGVLLKPGSAVEYSDLWPDPGFPAIPLLLEFAGGDRTGRGHNRSNQIHVLWRYDGEAGWTEIARTLSQSADWIPHMRAIALQELGGPPRPDPQMARKAAAGFIGSLDAQLRELGEGDRFLTLNLLYEQLLARMANGPILGT
jgi:hypothetical protein